MTREERDVLIKVAAKHPDEVARVLADALDAGADRLGRSLAARLARTLATDTFKAYIGILGLDDLVGPGAIR